MNLFILKLILKTKKAVFLAFMFILISLPWLNAQTNLNNASQGLIKGIVLDGQTLQPIQGANFVITNIRDTLKILGSASDKDGRFLIDKIPFGFYNAKISYIGYKTRSRKGVVFNAKTREINIDTVRIYPKSHSTAEVQIVGEKERIIHEKDRIILRADKELGTNAYDLLENLPMVGVDINGNPQIMGMKAKIYIDGVPASYFGIEKTEDLRTYSVYEIDKFELYTTPNPDFDVSAGTGVINIITKKIFDTKYTGQIYGNGNTKNLFSGSVSGAYNPKGMTIKGGFSEDRSNYNSSSTAFKTLSFGNNDNLINQADENNIKTVNDNIKLSFGLNSDINNILNYNLRYTNKNTDKDNKSLMTKSIADQAISSNSFTGSLNNTHQRFISNNLMYLKRSPESGRSFTAALSYRNNLMDVDNKINRSEVFSSSPDLTNNYITNNNSSNKNNNVSLLATYKHPIDSSFKLDLKYSGELLKLTMNNDYFDYNNDINGFVERMDQKISQNYSDLRNNFSGSIEWGLNGYSIRGGISYDNKYTKLEDDVRNYKFDHRFSAFNPSFSVRKTLSLGTMVMLGYNQMTGYPMNKQLNPYSDFSDSTNIVTGNPNLDPYTTDSFMLIIRSNSEQGMSTIEASYKKGKNIIEQVTSVENASLTRTTYKNIAGNEEYSFFIANYSQIFDWLTYDAVLFFAKTKYSGLNNSYEGTSWSASLRPSLKFSNLKLFLELHYNSPQYTSQVKTDGIFYANASIKQLFFDKKLSITLKASDIFNSMRNNSNTNGSGFYFINKTSETTRIFTLDIAWFFFSNNNNEVQEEKGEEYKDDF